MIKFTYQDFKEVKEKSEKFYRSVQDVYCPYFKEKVSFGSAGLDHISFKNKDTTRILQDQYIRFKLVFLAPEIIRLSHTLQGIRETKCFERVRVHNRTDSILKSVTYYEFIAIIKRNRVRVVIKQIDCGPKFFWSIIPSWKVNKASNSRILHDGIVE